MRYYLGKDIDWLISTKPQNDYLATIDISYCLWKIFQHREAASPMVIFSRLFRYISLKYPWYNFTIFKLIKRVKRSSVEAKITINIYELNYNFINIKVCQKHTFWPYKVSWHFMIDSAVIFSSINRLLIKLLTLKIYIYNSKLSIQLWWLLKYRFSYCQEAQVQRYLIS